MIIILCRCGRPCAISSPTTGSNIARKLQRLYLHQPSPREGRNLSSPTHPTSSRLQVHPRMRAAAAQLQAKVPAANPRMTRTGVSLAQTTDRAGPKSSFMILLSSCMVEIAWVSRLRALSRRKTGSRTLPLPDPWTRLRSAPSEAHRQHAGGGLPSLAAPPASQLPDPVRHRPATLLILASQTADEASTALEPPGRDRRGSGRLVQLPEAAEAAARGRAAARRARDRAALLRGIGRGFCGRVCCIGDGSLLPTKRSPWRRLGLLSR